MPSKDVHLEQKMTEVRHAGIHLLESFWKSVENIVSDEEMGGATQVFLEMILKEKMEVI